MKGTGTYSAVRLGPDKNPSHGETIAEHPGGGIGIPAEIMALWKPGEVAVVWSCNIPIRHLPQESLAKVRRSRLRRKLARTVPLLAEVIEQQELAKRPEFFAGQRDENQKPSP